MECSWRIFCQVRCLELERLSQEDELSVFRHSLQSQQQGNSDLKERVLRLEKTEQRLFEYVWDSWIFQIEVNWNLVNLKLAVLNMNCYW